ncbi:MAG: hypothetical protein LM549_18770, partial [Candidatus Competibacter sp.]|nr:hypothetical protein [Candidatus Competibacter sp.]
MMFSAAHRQRPSILDIIDHIVITLTKRACFIEYRLDFKSILSKISTFDYRPNHLRPASMRSRQHPNPREDLQDQYQSKRNSISKCLITSTC